MTILLLSGSNRVVRMQILAFLAPLVIRHLAGGSVKHHVASPIQPGDSLLVKVVKSSESPVMKEVLLHILYTVLYLAFRLGISRAAEDHIERTAFYICSEHSCHHIVTYVLIIQEHGILIVDDVLGDALEVLERLLMAVTADSLVKGLS